PGHWAFDGPGAGRMSHQLARTIEREIIPRLMLAHRVAHEPLLRTPETDERITVDDVSQFAKLVLSQGEEEAFVAIRVFRAREVSVESLYLDLLAPTARYLGKLWEEDLCNFTEVTVGLGRLQRVLRELSPALGRSVEHPIQGRRVLLLPCPGEQHTFGLVMVAEFFRRAGWDVTGGSWAAASDTAGMVNAEWFDVIGFSLGAETHVQALADTIAGVRQASCNGAVAIMVGGPLFGDQPELVARLGADGVALDGREAPMLAEGLIAARLQQRTTDCG
ncbi:MAG TPA: cobalamin B12-binding domain-containing protein, partial [Lautropia sp.]|nr:cobalamin B12-binding domain-containing protein [Lautropia sp.]